jgi:hypothetical protein
VDKTILYKPNLLVLMMFILNIYYVYSEERTRDEKKGKKGIRESAISSSSDYIVEFKPFWLC